MIKLLFCGDFVSQNPSDIEIDKQLKTLFSEQDFVAVNFEAPVKGLGNTIKKSGPPLTQSPDSPGFLESLGFNIIMLANNHMMDQGQEACEKSKKAFSNKVLVIGAGNSDACYRISIIQKNDIKIGLLNLTHKEFGIIDIDSTAGSYGTAWINHPSVNQLILSSKQFCDKLFVLPHAGIEDMEVPLPEWRARYREFVDLGADAVIASHPHTPQGWEIYKDKPIFYSLGNFYFDLFCPSYGQNWFKGLIVQLIIDDDRNLIYHIYNTQFGKNELVLDISENSKHFNDKLCELLNCPKKYKSYLNTWLLNLWPTYQLYLLRGLGAIKPTLDISILSHAGYGLFKGMNLPMLLNNFQCESHRWGIERMIRLTINK